jgi:hypothetical protein
MKKALSKDFSPNNPFSELIVSKINFAGPICDSYWVYDNETEPENPFMWENITPDDNRIITNGTETERYEFA